MTDNTEQTPKDPRFDALLLKLSAGLESMSIELTAPQEEKLIDYLLLLERWNKIHNLTAVRDIVEMVDRHLLDSLSIAGFVEGASVLDLGCGAGLPGIPLSIAKPDLSCMMVDSAERKTWFVQQAIVQLSLPNAQVRHARVQDKTLPVADCLVSRAFSSPVDIMNMSHHLCAPGGTFVFMMAHVGDLFKELPPFVEFEGAHRVQVAGSDSTRHIAICRKSA